LDGLRSDIEEIAVVWLFVHHLHAVFALACEQRRC